MSTLAAPVVTATAVPVERLSKDIKKMIQINPPSQREARYLVDTYYQMQDYRIAANNQIRKLGEDAEPSETLAWFGGQFDVLETQLRNALHLYAKMSPTGLWSLETFGIGPVIAAGLLANIDIRKAPTAGHIWSFAGLNPNQDWLGKAGATALVNEIVGKEKVVTTDHLIEISKRIHRKIELILNIINVQNKKDGPKVGTITPAMLIRALSMRPWNASLQRLCWLMGESFVKVSNRPESLYGRLYKERKAYETEKNLNGEYADAAKTSLEEHNFGKETDAYKAYIEGRLPLAHIHARAKRHAVKIFLSHWHDMATREVFGKPAPVPYILAYGEHTHVINPEVPYAQFL